MKPLKIIIVVVLLLAVALQVIAAPAPQAGAYSWKDSYINKLERELGHKEWKIERLTFELGEDMLAPVDNLLLYEKDCDDATAYMWLHFKALGYKVDIKHGKLEETNETKGEADHTWVLVHSGNQTYAYDWGYYYDDDQHYEGYIITYKGLLYLMMDDR